MFGQPNERSLLVMLGPAKFVRKGIVLQGLLPSLPISGSVSGFRHTSVIPIGNSVPDSGLLSGRGESHWVTVRRGLVKHILLVHKRLPGWKTQLIRFKRCCRGKQKEFHNCLWEYPPSDQQINLRKIWCVGFKSVKLILKGNISGNITVHTYQTLGVSVPRCRQEQPPWDRYVIRERNDLLPRPCFTVPYQVPPGLQRIGHYLQM